MRSQHFEYYIFCYFNGKLLLYGDRRHSTKQAVNLIFLGLTPWVLVMPY